MCEHFSWGREYRRHGWDTIDRESYIVHATREPIVATAGVNDLVQPYLNSGKQQCHSALLTCKAKLYR